MNKINKHSEGPSDSINIIKCLKVIKVKYYVYFMKVTYKFVASYRWLKKLHPSVLKLSVSMLLIHLGLKKKRVLNSNFWNVTTTGSPQLYFSFSFGILYGIQRLDILKLVLLNMVQNRINTKYFRGSNTKKITRSSSVWNMTHIESLLLWCYHFLHYVSRYTSTSIYTIIHFTCIYECPLCTAYFAYKQWTEYLRVYHQTFRYILYDNKPRYLVLRARITAILKMTISRAEDSVLTPKSVTGKKNKEKFNNFLQYNVADT
jgi:hypothetical protein